MDRKPETKQLDEIGGDLYRKSHEKFPGRGDKSKAFKKTFKGAWPDKPKDKLDVKDAVATAGYTGLGAAAGGLTAAAIGFNPVVGAALGGGLHLYNKAKEWRSNIRSMRQEGTEIDTYLEEILDETGLTPDELGALFEEIDAEEDTQYELFSAIMGDKPHDAMEAMDGLMKDKLGYDIEDYKQVLADVMFNPHNYEEVDDDDEGNGEEQDWEDEGGAVKGSEDEEETEQIDEISKKKLGQYMKKAGKQVSDMSGSASYYQGRHYDDEDFDSPEYGGTGIADKDMETARKVSSTLKRRGKGISKAVDRLSKEETEQIDEVGDTAKGKKMLRNYMMKAGESKDKAVILSPTRKKRHVGIERASDRLHKEEIEEEGTE